MGSQGADTAQQRREWDGIVRRSVSLVRRSINEEERTVEVICSTDSIDSHGDIVEQNFDLARYEKNPVVLWNHGPGYFCDDPVNEIPIGKAIKVGVVKGQLEATFKFATAKVSELAERVWQAFLEDMVRAVSIGFRPHDVSREVVDDVTIYHLDNNEIYEISVVPIPSNPDAVAKSIAREREWFRERAVLKSGALPEPDSKPTAAKNGPEQKEVRRMDQEVMKTALEKAQNEVTSLSTKLGAAEQRNTDLEARIKSLETELTSTKSDLTTQLTAAKGEVTKLQGELTAEKALSTKASEELKAASERIAKAEEQLIESAISDLVGKKLVPAEKDEYVALAKSLGVDRVKSLLANRPDVALTTPVTGADGKPLDQKSGGTPPPVEGGGSPLVDASKDLADMALKEAAEALKAQASNTGLRLG